jgi:hypothetical protein
MKIKILLKNSGEKIGKRKRIVYNLNSENEALSIIDFL